ncbi:hypothetical protein ColTof4_11921 [Colletotrichum tofieldiae]|nr:hypothetical protein ColTof4_11921 [Colletotrichum tofieldiae]
MPPATSGYGSHWCQQSEAKDGPSSTAVCSRERFLADLEHEAMPLFLDRHRGTGVTKPTPLRRRRILRSYSSNGPKPVPKKTKEISENRQVLGIWTLTLSDAAFVTIVHGDDIVSTASEPYHTPGDT